VPSPRHGVAAALTAVAYNLGHHIGSLPEGLGEAGRGTRVVDWLDLLVPLLVLMPALVTLAAAPADRTAYLLLGAGSWLYVSGHGIHLAANSIWNADPSPTAELWDEYVGHWVWYAGVFLVAVALARTMGGRPRTTHPLAWVLALASGTTWATNAVGGHFTGAGLLVAVAALGWGWRQRHGQGALWLAVGAAAVPLLVGAWAFGWDFD
jgi:hypothetical protein